jgi:2-amino-4-hydroxy-6-hydroxymethyldihydropteridine diphosphokinase
MNKSFLLIGGNEGDSLSWLAMARGQIEKTAGRIVQSSSIYRTAAWGKTDQADFLNQALQVSTPLAAPDLMKTLLEIEKMMGRQRGEKYGSRIIDIDILFFNDAVISLPGLIVPHPEVPNRRFALEPMAEIAPDHIHPLLGRSIRFLLAECPDHGDVKKIPLII